VQARQSSPWADVGPITVSVEIDTSAVLKRRPACCRVVCLLISYVHSLRNERTATKPGLQPSRVFQREGASGIHVHTYKYCDLDTGIPSSTPSNLEQLVHYLTYLKEGREQRELARAPQPQPSYLLPELTRGGTNGNCCATSTDRGRRCVDER
jgi:hypothetical protein